MSVTQLAREIWKQPRRLAKAGGSRFSMEQVILLHNLFRILSSRKPTSFFYGGGREGEGGEYGSLRSWFGKRLPRFPSPHPTQSNALSTCTVRVLRACEWYPTYAEPQTVYQWYSTIQHNAHMWLMLLCRRISLAETTGRNQKEQC